MSEECETKTEVLWENLEEFLGNLPRQVKLVLYADPEATWAEQEAVRLAESLADAFPTLVWELRPQQPNYDFWPVMAVQGLDEAEEIDFGVRIIGLPSGVQITSLVGAIQAVSFRGQQLEPMTRIRLSRLESTVDIELVSNHQDELGTVMATRCFSFAVASKYIRAFLIMADQFPSALDRHNVHTFPHIVLNNNIHLEGDVDEEIMLKHIAKASARA